MKTKRFLAGIIAAIVLCSLMAFSVSAAVKDVSINLSGPGQLYTVEDEYYFLDIYSSKTKLINASELEGAAEFSVRVKATNTTSYGYEFPLSLEIDIDEDDPFAGSYEGRVWLSKDGEYTISAALDSNFKVNPDTLGVFLSPSFDEEDPPEKDQIPSLQVLEVIVRKDVQESNTTPADDTSSIDNTVSADDTSSIDNAVSADDTSSIDNAVSAEGTVSTDANSSYNKSKASKTWLIILAVIAAIAALTAGVVVVIKKKQKSE